MVDVLLQWLSSHAGDQRDQRSAMPRLKLPVGLRKKKLVVIARSKMYGHTRAGDNATRSPPKTVHGWRLGSAIGHNFSLKLLHLNCHRLTFLVN